jgi:2-(1,2-epoxy-1,2-dihydrophenyl)acetyl-CoA isomerase
MSEVLSIERVSGVATVTLNRPESLNSLTTALKVALLDAVSDLAADDSVRAVVLTGAGRAFCAGQDLAEHDQALKSGGLSPLTTVSEHLNPIVLALLTMPKPVIAAVNGVAAGAGAGLALGCDLRIASTKASFVLAFANVGLTLDTGVSWTLPRIVGYARTTAMALLADAVSAEAALEMGMVNAVVDPDHVLPAAQELAARLAGGPTFAYASIKQSLLYGATATLPDVLAREAELQLACGTTQDHAHAVEAFLTKQKPSYVGH